MYYVITRLLFINKKKCLVFTAAHSINPVPLRECVEYIV